MKTLIFSLFGILATTVVIGQTYYDSATIHIYNPVQKVANSASTTLLFNYNPIISSKNHPHTEYKNKLDTESTLFVTYSSSTDTDIQKDIVKLTAGKDNIAISNKGITNNTLFNEINSKNGVIVCYQFKLNKIKKNNLLSIKDFIENKSGEETNLLELMYFPQVLDDKTRGIIESYFSIKYGISLTDTANYYASNGDTIWNPLMNEQFGTRITGIGRDDSNNLNQLQSHNSLFKGLTIGLNEISESNSSNAGNFNKDRTFLLWGDNDGSTRFETEGLNTDRISRTWKFNYSGKETIMTTFEIDSSDFISNDFNLDNKIFWLVRSVKDSIPLFEAEIIKQDLSANTIQFKDVEFTESIPNQFLSFIKAPEFFAVPRILNTCTIINNWNFDLRIIGGQPPYKVSLSNNFDDFKTADSSYIFISQLLPGTYTLKIIDNENRFYSEVFEIKGIGEENYIRKDWFITEHGYADILPEEQASNLDYSWYYDNQLISNETKCRVFEEGNYILKITDEKGCSLDTELKVSKLNNDNISIFPNPAPRNKLFTIQTKLPQLGNHVIIITDENSKVVKKLSRAKTDPSSFQESLSSPGTYFITLISDDKSYVTKLIVI